MRVQRALGDATLVARHETSDTGYAYLRLGALPQPARMQAAIVAQIQARFFVGDDFLPSALDSTE